VGCGCGGGKSGSNYEVTRSDGSKVTVKTIGDAQAIVARSGGTFKAVPAK
jgi:hypothetical protein